MKSNRNRKEKKKAAAATIIKIKMGARIMHKKVSTSQTTLR